MQATSHLLMIRPVNFGFNAETAVNNSFQKEIAGNVQQRALEEFDAFVDLLRQNKVDVTIIEDSNEPFTPDSIFPNNWISFHANGNMILYPMFAPNRRKERKSNVLEAVRKKFIVNKTIDLSKHEADGLFLEGTGSMVLDRQSKIIYACLSPRTNEELLNEFCKLMDYTLISFQAKNSTGVDIYHTNVMMCIASSYAVVCLRSIPDIQERKKLVDSLNKTNKEIIEISPAQLDHFAGNMLQVKDVNGHLILVMSSQAYRSLNKIQLMALIKHNRIIHSPLDTIETAGGGSARCMMAEVFLKKK